MSISPRAWFGRLIPPKAAARELGVFAGSLAGLLALGAAMPASANELRDIRIGNHAPQTHVVIEADAPFCADIALTELPYRLAIDLPELSGARPRPRPFGVIGGLGWSSQAPGRPQSRLVLDLKQPARVVETMVVPAANGKGFRRVVKLEPIEGRLFAQAQHQAAQIAAGGACGPTASSLPPAKAAAPAPVPAPAYGANPFIPGAAAAVPEKTTTRTAAAPQPAAAPAPAAPLASRIPKDGKWIVVIDPGHGGDDPGATSVGGEYEKSLTMEVAKVLRAKMEATKRYKVVLTRDGDEFVELRERTALGERREAHLFISLHADSISSRSVRGLSVYTLSEKASDAESEALADKENRADLIVGVDHSRQRSDEARNPLKWPLTFASVTHNSRQYRKLLVEEMRKQRIETLPNPRREAGFIVLKAPNVPSVLVEMGYLSNAADAKLLRNTNHQNRFAQTIIKAADRFFACPEVVKWFAGNEDEAVVGRGMSCAPSLAMDSEDARD